MTVLNIINAYNNGRQGKENPNPMCRHATEGWEMGVEATIVSDAKWMIETHGRFQPAGWIIIDLDPQSRQAMELAAQELDKRGMVERKKGMVKFIDRPIFARRPNT